MIAVGILLSALCVTAQEQGMEISGFRVPEYDAQGTMTSQLFGEHAVMEGRGEVKITEARMEFYREGETFMTVTSPYCFFDQKTREAWSDAPVAADMEGVHVRGRGFRLQSGERKVQVLNESQVTIEDIERQAEENVSTEKTINTNQVTVITSKELFLDYNGRTVRFEETVHVQDPRMEMDCSTLNVRFDENNNIDWIKAAGDDCRVEVGGMGEAVADGAIAPAEASGKTVITSKELFLDYEGRTVRFEKSVHVQDSRMEMNCGTMTLRFGENNQIDWIEALTAVRILSEGREAQAGKAVYDVATDEFLLGDNPKILDGRNVLLGDQIRFWRATGRMVCEPAARLVMYPDDKTKTNIFEN